MINNKLNKYFKMYNFDFKMVKLDFKIYINKYIMENTIGYIRDILRKEGITGMSSINHCIAFLISRLLDNQICKKFGVSEKYAFDNIMKDENGEIGEQELYDRFYRKTKPCFVRELVTKFKFSNIEFKLEGIHNLKLIMKKLEILDVKNLSVKYDLIGTIYEIHLKTGTSTSMRDLGQYYTHRLVIKYMIELCDIKMTNGIIEKTIDPTMGTGGFLTMAIKHLKSKYKQINWNKNKNNIIGFDIDENVKNLALLNVFLEIGELCTDTMIKQDTLHNDFKFNNDTILQKAKVILANEPMGIKNITHASCCDRIKNMKIRGTKAEPLFLQLFMEALDDGGRCAVIIPDGLLFNESNLHKNTRKHLIENFNLKKVVSLADDQFFLNTGMKTSILFFSNDKHKTQKVNFSEIIIDEDDNIKETSIIDIKYDKIRQFDYSLFVNKYNIEESQNIKGLEYQKIKDICHFLKKSKRKASFGKSEGPYPFYTSSSTIKRCNLVDYKDESIIIGDGGNANIYIDSNFSCSDHNHIIKVKTDIINNKFLKYYLQVNIYLLENGFKGATIKNLSKSHIQNLKIPIPSITVQNKIVNCLDVLTSNNNTLETNINELEKIMKYYIDCHTIGCEKNKIGNICTYEKKTKKLKTSDAKKQGKYRFYSSSQNKILYYDEYEFQNKHIIMGRGGNASVHIADHFSISHDDCYVISSPHLEYIYYYLLCNKDKLQLGFTGSTIKHLSKSFINNMNIPIPSKEKQKEIVEFCDNQCIMINSMINQKTKNKELMKNILEKNLNYIDNYNKSKINKEINVQVKAKKIKKKSRAKKTKNKTKNIQV